MTHLTDHHAFLFTDIVESTAAWDRCPTDMNGALKRHDQLIIGVALEYNGDVFAHLGDGFGIAFRSVGDAVAAAQEMHRVVRHSLLLQRLSLRLRIGIHAGSAESRSGTYVGLAVCIASRVCDLAPPGGTVLTCAVRNELDTIDLDDLGAVSLRGVRNPVELAALH